MEFGLATESFPIEYRKPMSMPMELDLVNIIQQLHQHLDPRTVFASFGQIMGQHLPLYGARLKYKDYLFHWGQQKGYSIEQTLTFAGQQLTIYYMLKAPLVPSQTQRLNQIQPLVLQALFNAIQYQEMSNQAMYDALTKLGNRHYYREILRKELARAERGEQSLSLIALDLDNFKQLNDDFGHQLGDSTLIEFSEMLNATIRDTDQAFRIGGDEFTILIQADAKIAAILCQRILNALSVHQYLDKYDVSTSMGIAQWQKNDTEKTLYQRADNALYDAKAAGRQCYKIQR